MNDNFDTDTPIEIETRQKIGIQFIGKYIDPYIPLYGTEGSSGVDLRADIKEPLTLTPGKSYTIDTGLKFELPHNFEGQVRSRSGLAFKYGAGVTHGMGTIDSDYTGEVKVFLTTLETFTISPGDRIAQMVFAKVERVLFDFVDITEKSSRGSNGFGSTGMK